VLVCCSLKKFVVLHCGTCHVVLGVCGECVGSALQCDMCHMRFAVLQCVTRHDVVECVAVCWECVAVPYVARTVQRIPHPPE